MKRIRNLISRLARRPLLCECGKPVQTYVNDGEFYVVPCASCIKYAIANDRAYEREYGHLPCE